MKKIGTAKTKPRLLVIVFMALLFAFGVFFSESRTYFNPVARSAMNDLEYGISVLCVALLFAAFFIFIRRYYKIRFNLPVFLFVLALFLGDAIAIFCFPGVYDTGELVYMPTIAQQLRYVLTYSVVCLSLYCIFAVFPQLIDSFSAWNLAFYVLIALSFVAIIFSYAIEWRIYLYILRNGGAQDAYAVPSSFTTNRNIYARLILYGLIAEAYLQCQNPRWWRWIIQLFFLGNIFFTLSKTTIAVALLFMFLFYLYRFFKTLKAHALRNGIIFVVLALIVFGGTALFFSGKMLDWFPYINKVFVIVVGSFQDTFDSSTLIRVYNWTDILQALYVSPISFTFGFGAYALQDVLSSLVFSFGRDQVPLDSAYVTIIAKNGLFGAVLYLVLVGFLFALILKSIKRKSSFGFLYLIILVVYAVLGISESVYCMDFVSTCTVSQILFVIPLLIEQHLANHPEIDLARQKDYVTPRKESKLFRSFANRFRSIEFLSVFPCSVLTVAFHFSSQLFFLTPYQATWWEVSIILLAVFLPFCLTSLLYFWEAKPRAAFVFALSVLALALLVLFVGPWIDLVAKYASLIFLGLFAFAVLYFAFSGGYAVIEPLFPALGYNLLYQAVFLSISYLISYSNQATPYLLLADVAFGCSLWLLAFIAFPVRKILGSFPDEWDHFENRLFRYRVKLDIRDEIRNRAYLTKWTPDKENA
jgi:hypothetical protein